MFNLKPDSRYEAPFDGELRHYTQLFLNREIWAVDARLLDFARNRIRLDTGFRGLIDMETLESGFIAALQNYLKLAEVKLHLPLPLQVKTGLVGIKDYAIYSNDYQKNPKSVRRDLTWSAEINSYGIDVAGFLKPFFELIYKTCGKERIAGS